MLIDAQFLLGKETHLMKNGEPSRYRPRIDRKETKVCSVLFL